jgi:hypothetical protein
MIKAFQNPIILTTLGIVLIAFLFFVWPTPYWYDRIVWTDGKSFPVRTNRFTGTPEWLLPGGGWKIMTSTETKTEELKFLLRLDLRAIDLSQLQWASTGFIKGPIYNPTNYRLMELTLRVRVYSKKEKRQLLERDYRDTVSISPRTVGDIIFDVGIKWDPDREWAINLIEAKGTQEVQIKTAQDFIDWKLSAVLRDPAFLQLTPKERMELKDTLLQKTWDEDFPEFKTLAKEEQFKVLEFWKKEETVRYRFVE